MKNDYNATPTLAELDFTTGFSPAQENVQEDFNKTASPSLFQRLKNRLINSLIQEIPPELEACEMCRETDCSQERWENCPARLAGIHGMHRE